MVLDPEQDGRAPAPGHPPDVDGIRDVAQVEVSRRCGREPRPARHAARAHRWRPLSGRSGVGVVTRLRSFAVTRLERPGRRHEPAIQREQVGLGQWAGVRHGDPEQDLPLPFRIADSAASRCVLGRPGGAGKFRALVQQPDDPPIQRIDLPAQSS